MSKWKHVRPWNIWFAIAFFGAPLVVAALTGTHVWYLP